MLSLIADSRPETAHLLNIYRFAEKAVEWKRKPDVVVCRFENLVGPKGSGSLVKQQKQVKKIAKAIQFTLTEQLLNKITNNLFGTKTGPSFPTTFYKGKRGAWRDFFTNHHIALFNKNWGHLQKALGYSID